MRIPSLPFALAGALSFLPLAGCDPGTSPVHGAPPASGTSALSVVPSLGTVLHAAVEVTCLADGVVIGNGDTGTTGVATITLTGACSGPVMLRLVSSGSTTYFDEKLDAWAPFSGTLRALLPAVAGGSVSAAITPLTEIAARQALQAAGSPAAVVASQVNAANTAVVTQLFGAGAAPLDILQPPVRWDDTTGAGDIGNTAAGRHALLLATLAGLGSGTAPALAATDALAGDLADGTLDGATTTGLAYTAGSFATQRDASLATFASYAAPALQAAMGIGTGGGGGSGGALSLPATDKSPLAASDIAGAVGSFDGVKARITHATTLFDASATTHHACQVTIAADGRVTVSANGESVAQRIDGDSVDRLSHGLDGSGDAHIAVGEPPATVTQGIDLDFGRERLVKASGYEYDTSISGGVVTKRIECWMPINQVTSEAGSAFSGGGSGRMLHATASDFAASVAGTYTGVLGVDHAISCTVTVGTDGSMSLVTAPYANTGGYAAVVAGDYDDSVIAGTINGVAGSWTLQAADRTDPVAGASQRITLTSIGGTITAQALQRVAGMSYDTGHQCEALQPGGTGGGGTGGGTTPTCTGGNICLTLGGQTWAMNASWYSLLGGKVGILFSDSAKELGLDIGSYHDTRDYAIADRSLWSGGARMHFDDKANNRHYVATAGTLTTTAWGANGEVTATFTATFTDQATQQTSEGTGVLVAVPQQ